MLNIKSSRKCRIKPIYIYIWTKTYVGMAWITTENAQCDIWHFYIIFGWIKLRICLRYARNPTSKTAANYSQNKAAANQASEDSKLAAELQFVYYVPTPKIQKSDILLPVIHHIRILTIRFSFLGSGLWWWTSELRIYIYTSFICRGSAVRYRKCIFV